MIKKKLIKIGLSTVILLQVAMPTFAEGHVLTLTEPVGNIPIIVPYMRYTARASANLIIDSKGNATVTASIDGYKGITDKVSINAELQQYKNGRWTKVTSFSDSDNSHRIRIYETTRVSKGCKYRVVTKVTAIHNGDKETKTITSSEQKY
ncbi:hypothetical protein [Tissierella praeacuta]|uniref:hypothetical protein n=1 Tax=Tissierella praeacuta TaxID=43131 RepID=UPI0033413F54